jgi:hypothetical protein
MRPQKHRNLEHAAFLLRTKRDAAKIVRLGPKQKSDNALPSFAFAPKADIVALASDVHEVPKGT